jgi:hypothetical protein
MSSVGGVGNASYSVSQLNAMQSQEFKAQRWMRLDFLRFWFVESWAPATAEAAASASVAAGTSPAGTQEKGMQISFKTLADFRQKLQHDQEVACTLPLAALMLGLVCDSFPRSFVRVPCGIMVSKFE